MIREKEQLEILIFSSVTARSQITTVLETADLDHFILFLIQLLSLLFS